ncbi:hypothetical protein [Streptomyces sp. NPDC020298]|uniref:hypothetical protein n=1 Tax=unclassified Streptomyces TaxID=2593676 RepID=UPI0033D7D3F0
MTDALTMRLLRSGVLAPPNRLDPPHQCCWIIDGDDYEHCGLWCDHDGDHVPYTPGAYLPPPIISPLGLLALQRCRWSCLVCPLCGRRGEYVSCDPPFRVRRDGDGSTSWYEPDDGPGDIEILWQFEPCGCEGREILPDLAVPGE